MRFARHLRLLIALLVALVVTTALRAQDEPFSFVHASDLLVTTDVSAGSDSEMVKLIWDEVSQAPQPAFVIITGDLTADGTSAQFAAFRTMLETLTVPHHPAIGDRDVQSDPTGKPGVAAALNRSTYGSWDHAGIHFVVLDSTIPFQHQGHIDQEQLEWLARDLRQVGTERPIIIALHHWVGRDKPIIDNERALLDAVAPYNVRLWLTGHGRADLTWDVNGAPAVMLKPLSQGSYHRVTVADGAITVQRRQFGQEQQRSRELFADAQMPQIERVDLASVPLERQAPVEWSAGATAEGAQIVITASGDLPSDTKLTYSIDGNRPAPLKSTGDHAWGATLPTTRVNPGHHDITIRAELPDGRRALIVTSATTSSLFSPAPAWTSEIGRGVMAPLALHDGVLYATTIGGDLVAIGADGMEQWRLRLPDIAHGAPAYFNGQLFVGTEDGSVSSIRAETREITWTHAMDAPVLASPAIAMNILCAAATDGSIVGLDVRTGDVKWTSDGGPPATSAVVTDGRYFVIAGHDGSLRGIEAITGRVAWDEPAADGSTGAGVPVVVHSVLYIARGDGSVEARNAVVGRRLWSHETEYRGGGTLTVAGNRVYASVGESGRLTCLDAKTGTVVWDAVTPAPIDAPPIVVGEIIYTIADHTLRAYSANDGREIWTYRLTPAHTLAAPVADDKHIYIATFAGQVIAVPLKSE